MVTNALYHHSKENEAQVERIQYQLEERYKEFELWNGVVQKIVADKNQDFWSFNTTFKKDFDEKHFSLFIFEEHELKYWSNSLTIPAIRDNQNGVVHLNNGWFFLKQKQIAQYQVLMLMQIKESFPTTNQYLKPQFLLDANIPGEIIISKEQGGKHGVSINNKEVFYLDFSKVDYRSSTESTWNVVAFILFIASILLLIYALFIKLPSGKRKGSIFVGLVISISLLRLIWLNNSIPKTVFQHVLFDPSIFAQSFLFPSLGDLLINSMIFILFISMLHKEGEMWLKRAIESSKQGLTILLLSITVFWVYSLNFLMEGLVKNSRIPFNIDHLFELDGFSFVAMLGIALMFLSLFVWIDFVVKALHKSGLSFKLFALFAFTLYAIYAVFLLANQNFDITETFWSLPVVLAIGVQQWYSNTKFGVGIGIFNLALISLFLAHVFEKYNTEKEHAIRLVIGERIAQMQDPLMEIKLDQLLNGIQHNEWVQQLFSKDSLNSNELAEIEVLFGNDWFRYSKSFKKNKNNIILFDRNPEQNLRFQSTLSPYAQFFHDEDVGIGYVFLLPITNRTDTLGYLQGVFTERSTPISSGFPQLLRSEKNYIQSYASEYTYARYFNGKRIYSSNDIAFPINANELSRDQQFEGYKLHAESSILILPEEYGFRWMIARPIPRLFQKVTTFSYLFLFMGFLAVLLMIIRQFLHQSSLFYFTLRSKIQLIFIAFSVVILTLYAFVIFNQITQQFHQRNKEQITERLNSIHIELGHKLGDVVDLREVSNNRLYSYLIKFSEVFVSDISLFDLDGQLSASSSSLIWDKNLLSMQMDPAVYQNVSILEQSRFIQDESIGTFTYLSGYRPLYNKHGDKIAYLNVPYFARQDELIREINGFMQVLINVFVLLMGISVIVAIYVSNWITSPLKLLEESFSSLDLINRNQPIKYSGNDELASLVKAYNLKVSELEKITEQIVQSEKEYAWQEMARQVAHEIKNPLTPMRLSIQHYQRLMESNPDAAQEKTPSLMKALIEQVDNLNHIANEFSRFAQISVSNQTEFELGELIDEVFVLYNNVEGVSLTTELADNCRIKADKGQIMRMLNNLIQNAIQATKNEDNREVTIRLLNSGNFYQIEIEDNGTGIPSELKEEVFKPKFTTKSKGMGLGLAIVHTIVSNHTGNIRFKNAANKGTIFIVELPLA
jgi:signal transduction histidine kinase